MSLNYSFSVDLVKQYRPPPKRLLDFGCGKADVAFLALNQGYDAYGVDTFLGVGAEEENLIAATQKMGHRVVKIDPNKKMPFDDGFFDIVISNQVFEHIPELTGIYEELARIICPGGILLTLMPTSEVLWEDHLKMPLVHLLPLGSKKQRLLMKIFRRIGFGGKNKSSDEEWISRANTILKSELFHRPANRYINDLSKHFELISEFEPEWSRYRIKDNGILKIISPIVELKILDRLLRYFVRKVAGSVFVFRRV